LAENGLFTVVVPHGLSIFLRFQYLSQLGRDVVRGAEVKAGHFFNHLLVQWKLQRLSVRKEILWWRAEALVHPGVVHNFVQAGTLLGIRNKHARDDMATF
jgi:hypothetical protein